MCLHRLHQMKRQNEQAIYYYQQYVQLVEDDGEAHHNLGLLYMAMGHTENALEAFKNVEKYLNPDNAESATNLAVGYFYRGKMQMAEILLQKALQFDPSYISALYHLSIVYLHCGQFQKAIEKFLNTAKSKFPNDLNSFLAKSH